MIDDSPHLRIDDDDLDGFESMSANPFKDFYEQKNMNVNINYNQIKSEKQDIGIHADYPSPLDTINETFSNQIKENKKVGKKELNNQPPLMISEIIR